MAEKKFDLESLKLPPYRSAPYLQQDSLRNRRIGDVCTGYSFQLGSMSYRGVWVSTIEKLELKVDGEEIPEDRIVFCVNGKKFLAPQLRELFAEFWHPLEPAEVLIYQLGGLSEGTHEVDMTVWRRNDFGYTHEFPATPNRDCRTMTLQK